MRVALTLTVDTLITRTRTGADTSHRGRHSRATSAPPPPRCTPLRNSSPLVLLIFSIHLFIYTYFTFCLFFNMRMCLVIPLVEHACVWARCFDMLFIVSPPPMGTDILIQYSQHDCLCEHVVIDRPTGPYYSIDGISFLHFVLIIIIICLFCLLIIILIKNMCLCLLLLLLFYVTHRNLYLHI